MCRALKGLVKDFRPGVLGKDQLTKLAAGPIRSIENLAPGSVDASSFDISIQAGDYWKMKKGVMKPEKAHRYKDLLRREQLAERATLGDSDALVIKPSETYVFQVNEGLSIPDDVPLCAYATGKSSIGRLDVLVRLVGDHQSRYDQVDPPFQSNLYVEITPFTFPIEVRKGDKVSQLRLFKGAPEVSRLSGDVLGLFGTSIKNASNKEELTVSAGAVEIATDVTACAFRAKTGCEVPIPLNAADESIRPEEYWEPIPADSDGIHIEKDRFHILRSRERFSLPGDIAVYGRAMAETLGEMRIHYAGFVHPHFGRRNTEGTPLIFEVRCHNIDVLLREEEPMALLEYYRMSEPAEDPGEGADPYGKQELKLAKFFKPWGSG